MDKRLEEIIRAFLRHSFNPVLDNYHGLTEGEKKICTEEEFGRLMGWVQSGHAEHDDDPLTCDHGVPMSANCEKCAKISQEKGYA